MRLLDLFAGIGGFSLGLERAGFETVAFCELDPWCRRVLAKHWPGVPSYDDVRLLTSARLRDDGVGPIEAISAGFPCQDVSLAGPGHGLAGERSGLWREAFRLTRDLRPRLLIVENVGPLRGRGLLEILGDLASIGFDAEAHAIPAASAGADHLRDRLFIVATPAPDASGRGLPQLRGLFGRIAGALAATEAPREGPPMPVFLRNLHGVSARVDRMRVKALGNAVYPPLVEIVGRAARECLDD